MSYYDTAPMRGYFLVDLAREGNELTYSTAIKADSPEDLTEKADQHAAEHGFVVVGATFAGRPVPGIGGDR